MAFGVKVSVSLDRSKMASFRKDIQTALDERTSKTPIRVKNIDITASALSGLSSKIQKELNKKPLTIKVDKIDVSSAVANVKKELTRMLAALSVQNGVNITGLRNFINADDVAAAAAAAQDVTAQVQNTAQATAEWKAQLATVDEVAKNVAASFRSATGAKNGVQDEASLTNITQKYTQWRTQVEQLKASKTAMQEESLNALIREGTAIQNLIASTQRLEAEERERLAASQAASTTEVAGAQQVLNLQMRIFDYMQRNPKAAAQYSAEFGDMMNLLGNSAGLTKAQLDSISLSFTQLRYRIKEANNEGKTLAGTITSAYQKFGGWALITHSMTRAVRALREMVTNVKELNAAMTELYKVTDETQATYDTFFDNASTRAKQLGATMTDTIEATSDFARVGYGIDEASDLADAALIYKNVGDNIEDISDASESIISTIKAFGMEAADAMAIIDRFNKVGNEFAITSDGIGEALQRSAASLATANNSLDQSIAMITAANSVVQNPETVGTALKTMSMRIRGATTELEDAGLDMDGMAVSTSALRDEILALTNVTGRGGFDIMLDEDTFRSTYEIMEGISAVWSEISDVDQAALLELIAGKRNSNVAASLLSNFSIAQEVLEASLNSSGSALAENDKYLESINGRLAVFEATFEDLSSSIMKSSFITGVIDFGIGLMEAFDGAVDSVGALIPIMTTLGTILGAMNIKSLISVNTSTIARMMSGVSGSSSSVGGFKGFFFGDAIESVQNYRTELIGLKQELASGTINQDTFNTKEANAFATTMANASRTTKDYAKSADVASMSQDEMVSGLIRYRLASIGARVASIALSTAISLGISIALTALIKVIASVINRQEELQQAAQDTAIALEQQLDEIDSLEKEYEGIVNGSNSETAATKQLLEFKQKLIDEYGFEREAIDAVNEGRKTYLELFNEERLEAQRQALGKNAEAYAAAVKTMTTTPRGYFAAVANASGTLGSVGASIFDDEALGRSIDKLNELGIILNTTLAGNGRQEFSIALPDPSDVTGSYELINSVLSYYQMVGRELTTAEQRIVYGFEKLQDVYGKVVDSDEAANYASHASAVAAVLIGDNQDIVDQITTIGDYYDALDELIELAGNVAGASPAVNEAIRSQLASSFSYLLAEEPTVADYQQRIDSLEKKLLSFQGTYGSTVDLVNRKKIEVTEDNLGNLDDFGVTTNDVGSAIDLPSKVYQDENAALVVTPVLPNGEVLSESELSSYIDNVIKNTVDGDYASADTKGIIIGVFDSESMDENLVNAENYVMKLHEINDEIVLLQEKMLVAPTGATFGFEKYSDSLVSVQEKVSALSDALDKINDGSITEDDLVGLLEDYPSLSPYLNDMTKLRSIIKDMIGAAGDGLISTIMGTTWASDADADSAMELVKFIQSMTEYTSPVEDSVATFAYLEAGVKGLSEALGELTDDGVVTVETIAGLNETFGDLESYNNFVAVLTNSKSTMAEAQAATNALASEWLNAQSFLDGLSAGLGDLYINMLKQLGVTNAVEVVQSKLDMLAATDAEAALEAAGLSGATWEVAQQFLLQSGATEATITSLQALRTDTLKTEIANTDFTKASAMVAVGLLNQAHAAGITADRLDILRRMYDLLERKAVNGGLTFYETEHFDELINGYKQQLMEGLDTDLQDFELPEITVKVPSSSDTELYVAEIDKVYKARKRLADIEEEAEAIQLTLDNTDDDKIASLEKQIDLQNQLTDVYARQQVALHELNNARDDEIASGVEKLRQLGFEIEYNSDTNDLYIDNLEHINELQGSGVDATNKLRKEAEKLWEAISDLNDENKEGSSTWWELNYSIQEAKIEVIDLLKSIVEQSSEAVDSIQSVYDTLHTAADEFAETGYISVDAFQDIVALGPQYMAYLRDENGLLTITEETINRVIAAKTEELALNNALTYVERLRLAMQKGSVEDLNNLLYATTEATDATWGLVYANLAVLGLEGDQYDAALNNINAIRSLAKTAIDSIGKTGESYLEQLENMQDGVNDLIEYVMDMLKQRIEDQVDAIEDMKDTFADYIELQKDALDNTREETEYQDEVANKLKDIAKLQRQIDDLSSDTSRESAAKRANLEEELAELNKELADYQSDYAYNAQIDSLDKIQEAYEDEKDNEIAILEDTISSYQKLYSSAISYIESHWSTLYDELIAWNTQSGDVLNDTITEAWYNALDAAQRYGTGVQDILNGLSGDIASSSGSSLNTVVGATGSYSDDYTSGYSSKASNIVSQMKSNSNKWASASADERRDLNEQNKQKAAELANLGITAIYDPIKGIWSILTDLLNPSNAGRKLYDCYHSGGVAGGGSLKEDELLAKLQKGEPVISNQDKDKLFSMIDFMTTMSSKLKQMDVLGAISGMTSRNGFAKSTADLSNVGTNNISVQIGETNIYGANGDTLEQHREISRNQVNQILDALALRK